MKDSERLSQLLESLGENAHSFAQKLDINTTNIYHVVNGRNKISKRLAMLIAAKFTQVNSEWLFKGRGEMYVASSDQNQRSVKSAGEITMAAGEYEFGNIVIDASSEKYCIPGISEGFLIRVRDNAMSPLYQAGDMVCARVLEPADLIVWGKSYIVLTGKTGFIRKLMPSALDDSMMLVSVNPLYPEFPVKKDTITMLAKINGVIHLE
jgi:phage repressor protein C with HTH and peptisase S24 domain